MEENRRQVYDCFRAKRQLVALCLKKDLINEAEAEILVSLAARAAIVDLGANFLETRIVPQIEEEIVPQIERGIEAIFTPENIARALR